MKPNLVFSTLLLFSILFVSCKKEETEAVTTSDASTNEPKEIIMPRVQAIPSQTYTQPPVTQNVAPVQSQQNGQTITPNPVATRPGMNPPHGQAGHRCDIAVGAPLNSPASISKPAATITQPNFTTSTMTNSTTTPPTTSPTATPAILNPNTPATTVTAPGMNPPHGQEGHDCAIAVGAPLPKK